MGIVRRKKDSRQTSDTREQAQTDQEGAQVEGAPPPPEIVCTVLIVSYNCRESLVQCLKALEASEGRESFEVLVVDCGSADGSGQIDEEFPEVNVLRLPRNFGRTKARNIGTRTAKGRYVLFLEAGVSVKPDCVRALAGVLDDDKSAGVVSPLIVNATRQADPIAGTLPSPSDLYRAWVAGEPWESTVRGDNAVSVSGVTQVGCGDPRAFMTVARFVKGMNYFDERYGEFGSEIELFTQAHRAGRKTLVLADAGASIHSERTIWDTAPPGARDTLMADYGNSVASYSGKHYGKMEGLKIRLRMCLRMLLSFRLGLLVGVVSGQKIDGSQTAL
jgi:GT2 family glycosyltransferase